MQAGNLYRQLDEAARARLVKAIATSLSRVSKDSIVAGSVAHFAAADQEYGARVAAAVRELRVEGGPAPDPTKESQVILPDPAPVG